MHRIAFGSTLAASILVSARLAAATTHLVLPGPGTPIQDAIDAAAPGDTIRLVAGVYTEHLTITKALKLRGVRSHSTDPFSVTTVSGDCAPGPVITVAADDVLIKKVAVSGDLEGGIDVQGRTRIKLKDVFVASNCNAISVAAINVVQSTRVTIDKAWCAGFTSFPINAAGIRVADTPQEGRIRIKKAIAGNYDIGIHLENNGILAVRVTANDVNFNERGIVLENTSRAIIDRNELVDNPTAGIELDATSSANRLIRNTVSGSVTDVSDAGTDNCWINTTYTTGSVPSCP